MIAIGIEEILEKRFLRLQLAHTIRHRLMWCETFTLIELERNNMALDPLYDDVGYHVQNYMIKELQTGLYAELILILGGRNQAFVRLDPADHTEAVDIYINVYLYILLHNTDTNTYTYT